MPYTTRVRPPGQHNLWGFLDDNNNMMPLVAAADAADLVAAKPVSAPVVSGGTVQQAWRLRPNMGRPPPYFALPRPGCRTVCGGQGMRGGGIN